MATGVDLQGLLPCPKCGADRGEHCRTAHQGALLPPCRARLVDEVLHLRKQRDGLQGANTAEVLRRRELERAATYVLKHVGGYAGILDHLKSALAYRPSRVLESNDAAPNPPSTP